MNYGFNSADIIIFRFDNIWFQHIIYLLRTENACFFKKKQTKKYYDLAIWIKMK